MIIQMLPNAEDGAIDALEEMIGKMDPMTTVISRVAENNKLLSAEALVQAVLDDIFANMPEEYQLETLESRYIQWECDCSRERLEQVLMTIGVRDLTEIIEEDGQAELQCQFCLSKYQFNEEELRAILASIS